MLKSADKMQGFKLHANDGEIGKVNSFLFDDESWEIMYLVADTGNWLIDRLVLISPVAIRQLQKDDDFIPVNLTKKQIENSPPISEHEPVSRQYEQQLFGYYQWPVYWNAGAGYYPFAAGYPDTAPAIIPEMVRKNRTDEREGDPHLRSTREVTGYNIKASDGEIGHIEDFIIDDVSWEIRYIIIDTKNFLPGKKVIISPKWINKIEWPQSKAYINFTKDQIRNSPEFKSVDDLNRDYEEKLYIYYDRKGYW